jgi:hypothetical protein
MIRFVRLPGAAMVVFLLACGASTDPIPAPTEDSVLGVYVLAVVNGISPPLAIGGDDRRRLDVLDGRMRLRAGHNFDDVLVTRLVTLDGSAEPVITTDSTSGTYTLSGSNIQLVYPNRGVVTIAVTSTQLHKSDGGYLFTYRK